jgi:uncharacterized protein related to proFAR isomerase
MNLNIYRGRTQIKLILKRNVFLHTIDFSKSVRLDKRRITANWNTGNDTNEDQEQDSSTSLDIRHNTLLLYNNSYRILTILPKIVQCRDKKFKQIVAGLIDSTN